MRTSESQGNIVVLSDIRREKSRALSPFGPVRAGLTTSQRIKEDRQLTELLNSLENVVDELKSKSYTVCDTLTIGIHRVRVALSDTTTEEAGTNE